MAANSQFETHDVAAAWDAASRDSVGRERLATPGLGYCKYHGETLRLTLSGSQARR